MPTAGDFAGAADFVAVVVADSAAVEAERG